MASIDKKLIKLSKSCIGEEEKRAVIDVLNHEYLGMGAEVQLFEEALSEYFGRPVVCVINGTAALHLALQACELTTDHEVIVPSLTYIASFQSITATGAKPIACDICPDTFLLDLDDAKRHITEKTKAIMPVHYTGGVGELDKLYDLADEFGLRVIEDAAHALGTVYHNKRVGSFGDIACFSFDGIKNITSGEGGCIVTDDKVVLQRVRDSRLLGVEEDTEQRYKGNRSWNFDVTTKGWRYHMSNINAAIGLQQLKRLPEFSKKRKKLAIKYDQIFLENKFITPISRDYNNVVPHIYVVRVHGMKNRIKIQQKLLNKGIQVGYHYQPNHWLSLFQDNNQRELPVTDAIFSELLTLPLHPDISDYEVEYIASTLIKLIDHD